MGPESILTIVVMDSGLDASMYVKAAPGAEPQALGSG
jgi:hypothetical protein